MKENSIEEDIKILEEFKTNGYHILLMKYGDRIKTNFKLEKAIEHIISDYKRTLKENEELNEKILDNAGIYQLGFKDGEESYIKKVEEKIEELKNESYQISLNSEVAFDSGIMKNNFKIQVLQELLESEE